MERRLRGCRHDASDASPEVLAQQLRQNPGRMDWVRIDAGAVSAQLRVALSAQATIGDRINAAASIRMTVRSV
jgi:hypothetical protein